MPWLPAEAREEVRRIVREEIAASRGETEGTYDRDHLPPRVRTIKTFNRRCRQGIEGAYKENGLWVVPREAWHRAMTKAKTTPPPTPANDAQPDQDVDAMIAAAGYRLTRAK